MHSIDSYCERFTSRNPVWAVWKVPFCQLAGLMLNDVLVFWKLFYNSCLEIFRNVRNNLWHKHDRTPARNEPAAPQAELMPRCNYLAPTVSSFDNFLIWRWCVTKNVSIKVRAFHSIFNLFSQCEELVREFVFDIYMHVCMGKKHYVT
jgi:hypothetical protein